MRAARPTKEELATFQGAAVDDLVAELEAVGDRVGIVIVSHQLPLVRRIAARIVLVRADGAYAIADDGGETQALPIERGTVLDSVTALESGWLARSRHSPGPDC